MSTEARGAREYAADDGFHEIQLSGKQLVFLFMATTVVSIVIFLCGVLVGRGGRSDVAPREALGTPVTVDDAGATVDASGDAAATAAVATPSADPGLDKATGLSDADSSYYAMLNGDEAKASIEPPPAEGDAPPASTAPADGTPKAPVPAPGPAAPRTAPAPSAAAPAVPAAAVAATPAPPRPGGWTIQVSAFRVRSQADQFASQLKAKSYDAYVADPDATSPLFRVRVGSFTERRDATRVADRLKKDKFKPWVTR